ALPARVLALEVLRDRHRDLADLAVLRAEHRLAEGLGLAPRRRRLGRHAQAVAGEDRLHPDDPFDLDEREPVLGQPRFPGRLGVGLLRLEVVDRGLDLLVEDRLELALDREALVLGQGDLGPEANLELVREVGALEREERFQVDARAADDLELVLLDRLLEGLPDEVLDRPAADLLPELALDHLRRDVAGAEALHAHVAAGLPERLPQGALELLARDGERDPRLAGTELLDGDLHGGG